jgi:hypothetical protein
MTGLPPAAIDHVVVNTRDGLETAAQIYRRLGFTLTPLSRHTLGSMNRLAIFAGDYLELVGIDPDAAVKRTELLAAPAGLDGLVFATEDADGVHRALAAAKLPVEDPLAFSRPIALPEGTADVRFRVTRVKFEATPYGRVYFCQHVTRSLVWRDEWRGHANGAIGVARMVIAAPEPDAAASLYRAMFGSDAVRAIAGGFSLAAGLARVDILSPAALAAEFGNAAPDAQGRPAFMAALTLRTLGLERALRTLAGNTDVRTANGRLLVPASAACGATLEFIE